jgi:radical SAM-linked protein
VRIRLRFTKVGKVRFLGHLDLARCWERAIRRAELPIAYSEGFSPRPKVHFGLALPTGAQSLAEYIDIDLTRPVELEGVATILSNLLPTGVEITGCSEVAGNAEALQAVVTSCTWRFSYDQGSISGSRLNDRCAEVLAADEIELELIRKKKPLVEDVRPAILGLTVESAAASEPALLAEVAVKPRSLKPSEILSILGEEFGTHRITRIEQWTVVEGQRVVPLEADLVSNPIEGVVLLEGSDVH